MSGYAVSGFVDGFFKGRDWRDSKEDRKLNRERQGRLDKITDEQHGANMRVYDRDEAKYQKQLARDKEADAFFKSLNLGAYDEAAVEQAPIEVPPNTATDPSMRPASTTTSTTSQPQQPSRGVHPSEMMPAQVQQPAQAGGVTGGGGASGGWGQQPAMQPAQGEGLGVRPMPRPEQQPMVPAQMPVQAGGGASGAWGAAPVDAAPAAVAPTVPQPIREVDPASSGLSQDIQTALRSGDIGAAVQKIGDSLALGKDGGAASSPVARGWGAVRDYVVETPEVAAKNSADRNKRAGAASWYRSSEAKDFFSQNPGAVTEAANDPVGFVERLATQQTGQQPAPQGAAPAAPAPTDRVPAPVAAVEEAAASTPVPQAVAQESVKVAAETAQELGLKPGQNLTKKQVDSASQAYVDRYYDTIVPKMIDFYIKRGDMQSAQSYVEIVESRQGKSAMRDVGRATFSVVNGDYDSAADSMIKAFKTLGYVDDAMEVDYDQTGIVKDEAGNAVGGKVVFTDKKTGNTFEKTFASPEEFIQYGHLMTSPEAVMEMLKKPPAEEKGAITKKDVLDAATKLVESTPGLSLTDARKQVVEGVGGAGGLGGLGQSAQGSDLYRTPVR